MTHTDYAASAKRPSIATTWLDRSSNERRPRSSERPISSSLTTELVDDVPLLHPEPQLFEAMLEGWRHQQLSRNLSLATINAGALTVRRFQARRLGAPPGLHGLGLGRRSDLRCGRHGQLWLEPLSFLVCAQRLRPT